MKNNKNMIINTKLSLIDYVTLVDLLVDDYFDITGKYQPHYGMANAMRLFYNLCVKDSQFENEIPHDFSDITLVEKLASDIDFIDEFNQAIYDEKADFSFGSAYHNALAIVNQKNNPMQSLVGVVDRFLSSFSTVISDVMTPDNIKITQSIANDIASGKIDFTKLMTAFSQSPEFEKIISSGEKDDHKDEPASTDNITPITGK